MLLCPPAHAGLVPYTTLPGAVASGTYTLRVNGEPVFVEKFGDVSYARFSFSGRADVAVTASTAITAASISPLSYGIAPVMADGGLSFSLTQPRKLILRINALEKLLIFADGPERDAPVRGAPGVFDVNAYLAPGRDPSVPVTAQLQQAIDTVAASNGGAGGVLVFPDGLYMSAQLNLRSRVRLHLESGALLRAVPSFTPANYPSQEADDSAFLYGQNIDQFSITGRGTLDGNGFQMRTNGPRDGNCKLVRFKSATHLVLQDFYARDSARWSFHFLDSDHVLAKNLKVMNDFRITTGPRPFVSNTDGFDIDASTDVRVEGNFIYTVDDAVTPKVTSYLQVDKPTQDVIIRNNVIWTHKSAMKVGLEINDAIHDIRFDSNDIVFADRLIALWNGGRHTISNIRVTHNRTETIGFKNDRSFFSFWINHNPPGRLQGITVNGLYAQAPALRHSLLEGYDADHRIEDFTIRNMFVAGAPVRRVEDVPLLLGNAFASPPTIVAPGEDGPPTVQVLADDDYGIEDADTASFVLSRAGSLDAPLTVQFSLSGSAVEGADYRATGGAVTFPAGAHQARVLIEPLADSVFENEETVVLQVLASAAYVLGEFASETLSLAGPTDPTAPPPAPPPPILSLAVIDAAASEAGDTAQVRIRRSGDTSEALPVSFSLSGSAVAGQDYSDPGSSLLPAGASSATLTLTPLADTLIEGTETLTLTLLENAGYALGEDISGTVTIADSAMPANTVSLIVNDGSASEAAGNTGLFSLSRSGSKTLPLTVYFSLEGTAINGVDYATLSSPVTITAGAGSIALTISPLQDRLLEGTETAVLRLSADAAYALGTTTTGTVNIADVPPPAVTLAVTDASASEAGNNNGVFTLSRSGSKTSAMTVRFTLSGSAGNGTDYATLASSAQIPAGASAVTLIVAPVLDTLVEGPETVVLDVTADEAYALGTTTTGSVTIADVTPVSVTVATTDSAASESGDTGSFSFTRTGSRTVPLSVSYTLGGSAINGVDYASFSGTLIIPANASSAILSLVPLADAEAEVSETVVLSLASRSTYRIGSAATGSVSIANVGPQE